MAAAMVNGSSGSEERPVNAETEEAFESLNPTTEMENPKLTTAFAVLIDVDGHVFVERNKELFTLPIEREITLLEVRRYAAEILADLQAQAAAEYTIARLEAFEAKKNSDED
jgi:hypothetical protein